MTEAAAYPVERRRGWQETPDTPARAVTDVWDERRADEVGMMRPQPEPVGRRGGTRPWLVVSSGELLTATTDGRLQIRDPFTLQVVWAHDLAPMRPNGGVPPAEARHW